MIESAPLMDLQDLYDWLYNQRPDGVGIPLKGTGIVLGLLLTVSHLWSWLKTERAMALSKKFPRHRGWGIALLAVALVWTLFLVQHMDMADFYPWRSKVLMALPVTFILMVIYVPEFLAVRALGCLMLLGASPVLHAAFLHPQTSRLFLPILAYAWVIMGMFCVGSPYLFRDWVDYLSARPSLWKLSALGGLIYGVLLLVAALVSY